jgi:hypothetical protein
MKIDFLLLGMIAFLIGQIFRAVRWQILLPNDSNTEKRGLLLYVSIGSLLNALLPFRVGDLMRASLLSRNSNIRFSASLASIVIERMTDVLVILLAIFILSILRMNEGIEINAWIITLPVSVIGVWLAIKYIPKTRETIFTFSSIWNQKIQLQVLDFFWAISTQLNHARFFSKLYIITTVIMWFFYFGAYYFFFSSLQTISLSQLFNIFHGNPFTSVLSMRLIEHNNFEVLASTALFLLTPIFASLFYSSVFFSKNIYKNSLKSFSNFSQYISLINHGVPSQFSTINPYNSFLISHFSGQDKTLKNLGLAGFKNSKITRIFLGGSNAITAIIENNSSIKIRKVAHITDRERLHDQYEWLIKNKTLIPVTNAFNWTSDGECCYYEMPYEYKSLDMYEWTHIVDVQDSISMLTNIINELNIYHNNTLIVKASDRYLEEYLTNKVLNNIKTIKSVVSDYLDISNYKINGVKYSVSEWDFLLSSNLANYFTYNSQVQIHGDLTIENIIIKENGDWYLIDPNPSKNYSTALMDWAKLLQSLNKGYENLNRYVSCLVANDGIEFINQRSDKYQALHNLVISSIKVNFPNNGVREADLHEIIHYLRLIPYKFSSGSESGLLFFAITCILIREFKIKYEVN